MSLEIPRQNNFDLIRLFAALQVVFGHVIHFLPIQNKEINTFFDQLLAFFPGVPIFFFLSGFLVYWSFKRNKNNIKKFYWHRFLRIFPGLWLCFFLSLCLILYHFPQPITDLFFDKTFYVWLLGQVSIFQFYTPNILRFWGIGAPNGALWTIGVEVQFYLLVPILYYIFAKKRRIVPSAFFLMGISLFLYSTYLATDESKMLSKLLHVFSLSHLFIFLSGILAFLYWKKIAKHVIGKVNFWAVIYVVFCFIKLLLGGIEEAYPSNFICMVLSYILLFPLILSFAFSHTWLSKKLLAGNDISYGIYIYHMLVVNFFIHHGWVNHSYLLPIIYAIVILLACLSWIFIEKKALSWKKMI